MFLNYHKAAMKLLKESGKDEIDVPLEDIQEISVTDLGSFEEYPINISFDSQKRSYKIRKV